MRWYGYVTRVDVFDSRVDGWYAPGGMVRDHARKVARYVRDESRREAPKRRGLLRRRISANVASRGKRHLVSYAQAKTHYAYWVHEGRGAQPGGKYLRGATPTRASHGKWGPAPPKGGWPKYTKKGIAEQRPDPFLIRGMERAALRFPGGGVLPPVLRSRGRGLR